MALFDQFGPAQANNGQAPPSPQTTFGAPGFPSGSWGNQPPNMAGGLQQFLASRGMARPLMPNQGGGNVAPGTPTTASQPPLSGIAMPTGAMPQQPGMPMNASQGPSSAAVMPQQSSMLGAPQPGGGASSPYGAPNFAGGMQQFLGARPT